MHGVESYIISCWWCVVLGPLRERYLKSAFFQCSPQWGYAAVKITGRKNRQDFSNMTTKHVIKKYRSNAWYQCNVCINMVSLALDKITLFGWKRLLTSMGTEYLKKPNLHKMKGCRSAMLN